MQNCCYTENGFLYLNLPDEVARVLGIYNAIMEGMPFPTAHVNIRDNPCYITF